MDYQDRIKAVLLDNITITKDTNCWVWGRALNSYGYGSMRYNGIVDATHRVSYELFKGPIPDNLQVLHHCDNPPCINPDHLYVGTTTDNGADAVARKRNFNTAKTHCKNGHEFTLNNTRTYYSYGTLRRACIKCSIELSC